MAEKQFRGGRKRPPTKTQIRQAILKSQGVMTNAAAHLGRTWGTTKKYIHKYPDLLDLFNEQVDRVTDVAENNLISDLYAGEQWATKFWLTTKGRNRGFGEHTEIEQIGDITVRVQIES